MSEPTLQVMYIGPSIKGIAKSGAVFLGKIPERITKLSEDLPISRLLVPVDKITAGMKAVREAGTVEYLAYQEIANYIKGGLKNV